MSDTGVPHRKEVATEHTWHKESVFPSREEWQAAAEALVAECQAVGAHRGQLGESPARLLAGIRAVERVRLREARIFLYAGMAHKVDSSDPQGAEMFDQARNLRGRAHAATAFLEPEILELGEERIDRWVRIGPELSVYTHYFNDLFRREGHVRSVEVEEVLGMLEDPFSGPQTASHVLTNADLRFKPAATEAGEEITVTQGTLDRILAGPDRAARRSAWQHHTDGYLGVRNTLAVQLASSLKQSVFQMRVRRHPSTLEAALFTNRIPAAVFHQVVEAFRSHLPVWHRYWALRRKALKVAELHPYDIWAPLSQTHVSIPYPRAVHWICRGLEPMGEPYVAVLRRGCLEERWVDVYPNRGKSAGAFSWGVPGTRPFIVMNYTDDMESLSTLAHELGHSMHSYLSWEHQPFAYTEYSVFAAEVASNFHQALVRAYLLDHQKDPVFQMQVLEEAMSHFYRYLFVMPTLARFELETHRWAEQGRGLTAREMTRLMAELFGEGYGGEVQVDPERVGITWATFAHLYHDYYVFQYVTGIAGGHLLANRVLSEGSRARDQYLDFLKKGGSAYPLDALKEAGVDLASPAAVEAAFETLSSFVDRIGDLLELQ